MKQFELTLIRRKDKELEIDKVEGDDLVEILAKLLIVIAEVQKRLDKEIGPRWDDDIPF